MSKVALVLANFNHVVVLHTISTLLGFATAFYLWDSLQWHSYPPLSHLCLDPKLIHNKFIMLPCFIDTHNKRFKCLHDVCHISIQPQEFKSSISHS